VTTPNETSNECQKCHGDGYIIRDVDTYWGPEAQACDCEDCEGTGREQKEQR
jgi:DnaJ-class molecular chaperone